MLDSVLRCEENGALRNILVAAIEGLSSTDFGCLDAARTVLMVFEVSLKVPNTMARF